MRIAQVSPLFESVPPQLYGGTERVVSYLTEELVRAGHEVTLFASADSRTSARLVPCGERALRLGGDCREEVAPHLLMIEQVIQQRRQFDIIHFHVDYLHFPLSRAYDLTQLTTLHGRLDLPEILPLHREFTDMPLVSISQSQRSPLPEANWAGTVHHGLPPDLLPFQPRPDDYLVFLGRVSPEKGLERAIRIAESSRTLLRIAAKVDGDDVSYFETKLRPLLNSPFVEFLGEIDDGRKPEFLGKAKGMLFPIDWPEPFGLVMIEAMACGTPVIAYPNGSVPEILEEGRTGFLVDSVEAGVDAVKRLEAVDRRGCRRRFEERFSASRMARDYVHIYEQVIATRSSVMSVAS